MSVVANFAPEERSSGGFLPAQNVHKLSQNQLTHRAWEALSSVGARHV